MKISIFVLASLLLVGTACAQEVPKVLTLEYAIAQALENNQALQIEQRQVAIANNNVFAANAGLVPTISFLGNASYQNNDTEGLIRTFQESPSPSTVGISDGAAATTTYSAVIQADYVLLGGFSGRHRLQLLRQQNDLASQQQQAAINKTIVAVSELFLEIAKLQSQEELLTKNVAIGEERLNRTEDQFKFGKVTGLAVLRAKTDLNQDRTFLDQVLVANNNLKRDLNFLIGLEAEAKYRVSVSYQPPKLLSVPDLKSEIIANNPTVRLSQKGVAVSDSQYKLATSRRLPTVNMFANYGYFNQENDLQQLAEIQTVGYNVGVGVRYNLFNGGRTNRNIQQAKLTQEISKIRLTQTEDRIIADAIKEYNRLQLLQNQLEREEENVVTFQENYLRTEERFYNGKVPSVDLRDAQNALLNAEIVINNLKADIMKSSLRLEALKGNLLVK